MCDTFKNDCPNHFSGFKRILIDSPMGPLYYHFFWEDPSKNSYIGKLALNFS
jgi:hypothetical protein